MHDMCVCVCVCVRIQRNKLHDYKVRTSCSGAKKKKMMMRRNKNQRKKTLKKKIEFHASQPIHDFNGMSVLFQQFSV